MAVLSTVKDVFSIITPFAILILGWWWNSHQKKIQKRDEEARAAYMRELEARDQKRDEAIRRLDTAIETIDTTMGTVRAIDGRLDRLERKVDQTASLNKLNGQYTNEVAELVTAVAEGLRDKHMDGNITSAVSRFRNFESKALGLFISGDALQED